MGSCPQTRPPPPTSGQERRGYPPLSALRRSRSDRKALGVAGGLGQWAGVDPLVFRVLFVVLTVFGGSGLLLYALGWLLVPEDGETESEAQRLVNGRSRSSAATVIGILVVLVIGIAATGWFIDSGPGFGGLGALVAVIAIVVLISRNHRDGPVTGTGPGAVAGRAAARPGRARCLRADPGHGLRRGPVTGSAARQRRRRAAARRRTPRPARTPCTSRRRPRHRGSGRSSAGSRSAWP